MPFAVGLRSKYQLSNKSAAECAETVLNKNSDSNSPDAELQHAPWTIPPSNQLWSQQEDPQMSALAETAGGAMQTVVHFSGGCSVPVRDNLNQ